MIERKMDNCKPCGGAIPLCMISPSNREVDIGETLKPTEYIGMTRREVLDDYLRQRAEECGTTVINGLFMGMEQKEGEKGPWTLDVNTKKDGEKEKVGLEVDVVIGADGANSRVAKIIDAGDYDYAIAYQERIRIDQERMKFYENMAEMYVGDDVSPDFYGWVFPKYDHVGVGTGTVINKTAIKKYQDAIRDRAGDKISGGQIIKIEAHPIPEHPRPKRIEGRVALVGDAAGYVTKCSGEGIYFAAKSGRMCGEAIVEQTAKGTRMVDESDLRIYLDRWDKKYMLTYQVLDILQKVFYRNNPAREAFVEMCSSEYVQRMTFDSYLYKTVVPGNPLEDLKLAVNTIGSIVRASAMSKSKKEGITFGSDAHARNTSTAPAASR